ncbi:MAG: type II secretion system protein GspM [Alcanivoracaceae bacterium]
MATFDSFIKPLQQRMAPLQVWYAGREPREQLALKVLGVALVLTLLALLVWQPLLNMRTDAEARYVSNSRLLAWIEDNSAAVRAASQSTPRPAANGGGDWISQLSRSAGTAGIALRGFNPEGDNAVRIQIESQPFVEVLAWLQQLESSQGIQVANAEFSSTTAVGQVNLRATLRRQP